VTVRSSATREVLGGSARVFMAEALILPTALVTAGFLTRRLGPSDYGLLTLSTAIVVWLEWTLTALFARASVKLVADADDWRPAGAAVLRLFGASGVAGALVLWMVAAPIASLMHEPSLARYLRILALDVPLFMLSQAHLQILVGTGAYTSRAIVAASRWTVRMVLVISLVAAGLSIDGALLGILGSSVVELLVARRFVRPTMRSAHGSARALWSLALPLFVAAMSMRLFDKLDLFTLKALGGSAALAGQYGAAQNLTIIPGLVALSLASLLISTLSRSLRAGDEAGARALARNALRGVLLLFPFAGMTAGAATAVTVVIFGRHFAPAGPMLALLIFGAIVIVMMSTISAILVAKGKAAWTMYMALPIPLAALVAHLAIIPLYGALGAAAVTVGVAALGAAIALAAMYRAWRVLPPAGTALRALIVTVLAYALAAWWGATGVGVVIEIAVIALLIPAALWAFGEFSPSERAALVALLRRPRLDAVPAEPR
jgi:O-antigen/teichoic acid export membrane protein